MEQFYSILSRATSDDGTHVYTLSINPEHAIFQGHFPGRPIVPGVMTLYLVRQCAEQDAQLGATRLASVKEAKYLSPIIPDGRPVTISFTIDADLNIKATVTDPDGVEYTRVKAQIVKI